MMRRGSYYKVGGVEKRKVEDDVKMEEFWGLTNLKQVCRYFYTVGGNDFKSLILMFVCHSSIPHFVT